MAGPKDPAAAGRGRLRVGHADREQVIETLKDAFVHGRLTRHELDTRAGRALTAQTRADLAALTADIPAVPSAPAAAGLARPPAPARRRPLARAATGSGGCLVIAAAAVWVAFILDPGPPGPTPYHSWAKPFLLLALCAVLTAVSILVVGVAASVDQRRSRGQLPPRPEQGEAPEIQRPGQVSHDPALPRDRPDQARADLRSDSSRPGRPHSSGPGGRAPRGIRPVTDAV